MIGRLQGWIGAALYFLLISALVAFLASLILARVFGGNQDDYLLASGWVVTAMIAATVLQSQSKD